MLIQPVNGRSGHVSEQVTSVKGGRPAKRRSEPMHVNETRGESGSSSSGGKEHECGAGRLLSRLHSGLEEKVTGTSHVLLPETHDETLSPVSHTASHRTRSCKQSR